MDLLIDLHLRQTRQGPGGDAETRLALSLSGLSQREDLRVADIGCGTGAAALVLAKELTAEVTAVDLFPAFLAELEARAKTAGLEHAITTLEASMDSLPFEAASLDVIWSEGAIYNIGFETGLKTWRPFLKPGGILAVSELTWLTAIRPAELTAHWDREYPEVDLASAKIALLERHGFRPLGYFPLPRDCWIDDYYRPLENAFEPFLDRHKRSDAAQRIVEAERQEIALYEENAAFVSYGFFVAQKIED